MSNNKAVALTPKDVRNQVTAMSTDFAASLPKHIPSEKFERVLITAISNSPEIQQAMRENPRSVMNAATKAAQDGLIPDGREAALVVFNTKQKINGKDEWRKSAVYMPMVYGLMKKVRQSGGVSALYEPQIVYKNDYFVYELGFNPKLEHTPLMVGDRGDVIGAYAVAKLDDKSQSIVSAFLTLREIEKIRAVSKAAKRGPWVDWWEEMAKKSAMRRLCKYLPSSSDLDAAFTRDESYNPHEHVGELETIETVTEPRPTKEPDQIEEKPESFGAVVDEHGEVGEEHKTHGEWAERFLLLVSGLEHEQDVNQVFENNAEGLKNLHEIDPEKASVLLAEKPKTSNFPSDDNYKAPDKE